MSKRKIKQIALGGILSVLPLYTYAISEGMYIGLMGGYATNNGGPQTAFVTLADGTAAAITVKPKSNQGAVRFYLGYKFNHWFGAEMGGSCYSEVNYDTGGVAVVPNTSIKAGVAAVDFVAMGAFPIKDWVEAYGKAGIAVTYQGQSRSLKPAVPGQTSNNRYQVGAKPTYSVGVGYQASQSFLVDVSMTTINTGSPLSSVTMYAIGFSYHIVNVYCGQFLCDG